MNKQFLYADAFIAPLIIRELSDSSIQFASLKPEVIERIKAESNNRGFGRFGDAPAWAKDVGHIKRAHLYVSWLFDVEEVAFYLAEIAQCEYIINLMVEGKQGYTGIIGDSSEHRQG